MSSQQTDAESGDGVLPKPSAQDEWPKKIRTLSESELDRLTIDAEGRFYRDGRLVDNGERPEAGADPATAPAPVPSTTPALAADHTAPPDVVPPPETIRPERRLTIEPMSPQADRPTRLTLSGGQSFMLLLAVIALLVTAAGVATHAAIALHDWGSRTGAWNETCAIPASMPASGRELPS